jgi:hypothetical protein
MIEKLMDFFSRPKTETKDTVPEGLCPNCWGTQEYDNTIRELYKDKQIDVNNHSAHYAFIQDFVVNQIDGIHLKKGENSLECPTCHAKYEK